MGTTSVTVQHHTLRGVRFGSEQVRHPVAWEGTALDLVGPKHEVREQKKGTAAWSAVTYLEGAERGKRGVQAATALVLDFDHIRRDVADEIRSALRERAWAFVAASSYSHLADGPDDWCFRLLLFVSRPVLPAEFDGLWAEVHAALGGHSDRHARDISRIWYVASCPEARAGHAWVRHADGSALDVDALIAQSAPSRRHRNAAVATPDDGVAPISEGRRHAHLLGLAGAMRRRGSDRDAIFDALVACNAARCVPSLELVDVALIADAVARYDPTSPMLAANQTDIGNAERFEAFAGARFRFVHAWGAWLAYDGRRWARDGDGAIVRMARDTLRAMAAQAASMPEGDARSRLENHAIASERASRVSAMLTLAQSLLPVAVDHLDRELDRLNCHNGTLDLHDGTLQPHGSADLLTRMVPVPFDPTAVCPLWEAFLDRVLGGNRALVEFIQRAVGYSLTGHTTEQVLFLLHGTGANGKSTFVETLRALLGDYATIADFSTFLRRDSDGARNDLARLVGARFVPAVEADAGAFLAESLVKQVTGGDTITARFLFKEFFDYRPQFKIWLAANHKPNIAGGDHGIWRRIRLVPFTVTIPETERDPNLVARLVEELPGILAWAVRGCLAWRIGGLGLPDAVRSATNSYRDEMDAFAPFLDGCCVAEPSARMTAKDLYGAYQAWCAANGEKERSQKALGTRLLERGLTKGRGTAGVRIWDGLRLRRADEPEGPEWRVAHSDASSGYLPNDRARASEAKPAVGVGGAPSVIFSGYPKHAPQHATRHSPNDAEWEEGDL